MSMSRWFAWLQLPQSHTYTASIRDYPFRLLSMIGVSRFCGSRALLHDFKFSFHGLFISRKAFLAPTTVSGANQLLNKGWVG